MLSPTPIDRPSLHPGTYLIAPRVPHGLAAVVEGLTREVLRHRPEDIYVFAAHHFEKLLKLREQYYAEEYNDREFNHDFNREFNLWSSKETEDIRKVSHSGWSLRKEIESLEKHRREYTDAEESAEDVSIDRENRKTSKNLKGLSRETKRVSKRPKDNETTSDARAARIISQMSAKSIQTKDIKQELRKNKLSGEKAKTTDTAEKGVKGERRNRTKVLKMPGEETERSTTITTSSSRTSARRPLKKVRRIETESETETEREINKTGNGHCRPNVKNDRKAKARTSEYSSERRISSRAISMDRIRAYVLRKFASTASLEVLRSPTYVEQVQEVIDRAAPIIKEKLEEIRRPRGKRSRSVDLAWNRESLREYARDEKRRCDHEEEEGRRERNENAELERRANIVKKEKSCLARKENISNAEGEEKKARIRNVGSGKRSRRRDYRDLEAVDRVDDNSRHKSDNEPDVSCDTLEARLTATENILKDISRTTSELSGARKGESPENAPSELEMSDANVVSLPIVRPPSSKNSRSATKNDLDNLTLPPISPEAPKSTKKKDELSLPILSANGNHSKKSREQDDLKDVEEASTMRDITSDIEDTAIFPEDSYESKKDLSDDCHDLISDARITDEGTREGEDKVLQEDVSENLAEKQGSFEELEKLIELEGQKLEENFKDSLNVTPEIVDLPSRPDSLEEEKFQDGNVDTPQNKTFDGLKDKLIEIEMAERNIEKTLAGQSTATYENGREKSNKDNKEKKDVNEKKEPIHELEQVKGDEIEKSSNKTNKVENLKNKAAIKQAEISTKRAEKIDDVEDVAIKLHREYMQSVNPELQSRDGQMITEMITRETSNGKATASKNKSESETSKSTGIATSENTTDKVSTVNIPNENDTGKKKDRKKREAEKLPATTALSLEIPFAYVLSEGSPCEIPESVTTVIIPDRQCSSPVIAEDDNQQKEQSLILSNVTKTQKKNQEEYGVEAFGEYIQAESAVSSMDIDFMQGIKPTQNVVISHQDLDRIKEEGEEEEKEDSDKDIKKEMKHSEEKRDDNQAVIQNEEMPKLENITEHEENEHIDTKIISEHKDTEEVSSAISENRSLPDIMEFVADTSLTDVERIDTMVESKSTLENSSEESGSSQNTTMTSDTKEDLASTRSTETPSLPIPVVPELNLDSLQDNTVSSFKITASETKEDNGSLRESDATSLIEPLTSDERLMNRVALTDHDEEVAVEKFTGRDLRSELPEADQLYRAEHAEYVWLEKDPLSSDTNLEDEAKSQENSIGLTTLSENVVHAGPFLREEENDEELNSEEEIARELIGSLDEEIQLRANEFNLKEKSEDNRKLEKNGLSVNEKSNRLLSEFVQSVSADEPKKIEHEISSVNETMKTDKEVTRSEELSVVSSHVTDNNNDIAITNKEHEESELEVKEEDHEIEVAPLAQFEQDELLEENDKIDKITIEDVSNINNFIDNQEQSEDKETSIEEVIDINESTSKEEELNKNQKENEQGKLQSPEKSIQKELQIQEEYEQEDLKLHEEDNEKKLKLQEEIADKKEISAKVTESGKDSINGSIKNNEKREAKQISCDDFVTKKKEDIESKKEENAKPFSAEVEPVHGPIVSAITEESVEDHPHDRYRTMRTKSSTVETMIEADGSNIIDENTKAAVNLEIIESLAQNKDDIYSSAAVKIQACVRGFLVRRQKRKDLESELVLPMQKTITYPSRSLRESKSGRRLRREVALQNTTLSLENAFATGRLQHTGEFHDSVPLPLFDIANSETTSIQSNESLINEVEESTEEDKQPDVAQSSTDQSDCVNAHEIEQGGSFQKNKNFADYPFPIMMQLLTDASRNCRFAVSQNPHSDFNANVGGMKLMEPTVDIVMLGYPRNDDNQYLNFITSVEDLGSNMNSLSQENATRYSKNTGDDYPSMTSGEGSIREPLALLGTPQGVVIEEVTSLEAELPSESTNLSAVTKTSLDTNSSAPLEEYTAKDEKNELGASKGEGIERQTPTPKSQEEEDRMKEHDLNSEDDNTKSDKIFHDNHENVDEEKKEKSFP